MKIRTTKYIIKDGLINTYRNKLMSLASIGIVAVSLLVFGLFYIISVNISHTTSDVLNKQSEVEVFCDYKLDDSQARQIEDAIKNNSNVQEYTMITKREALERAKNMLGSDKKVLEGYDSSFLPISFIVKLKDTSKCTETVNELKKLNGVDDVSFQEEAVDLVSKVAHWVRIISLFLIIVLLTVSAFIIANTIKLTVFARRKEINIMKYIGATDWYIRLPFVVEGVVIGFMGALIAFLIVTLCYNTFATNFKSDMLGININLVKINEMGTDIFGISAVIGMIVGGIGSIMSIRKYLRV